MRLRAMGKQHQSACMGTGASLAKRAPPCCAQYTRAFLIQIPHFMGKTARMPPPEDPVVIAFDKGREAAEHEAKLLCTRILPGWAAFTPDQLQVSPISGGISNLLVKVQPPPPLRAVAVKVFGDKTELLIDREAEKRTLLQLNTRGFGAPVVGLFGNGRVEAFLTAKTLTPEEMCDPRFVPHIAARLRAFHDLPMDPPTPPTSAAAERGGAAAASGGGGAGEPGGGSGGRSGAAAAGEGGASAATPGSLQSSQWDAIHGWLDMAAGLSFAHDPAKQAAFARVDFGALRSELAELAAVCGRVGSTRVFCHNDLLSGNILVVQVGRQAACYGQRGFDLGNHFNEYAGFDCVYDRFPSGEQQKAFFRHYLLPGELRALALAQLAAAAPGEAALAAAAAANGAAEEQAVAAAEERVLERMRAEACVYALASHAYWGVWSYIQARYSPIDFDYLSYSELRWAEYRRRKAEFFALVDEHFPPAADAP
uniref:ethanolamine kinase n=1 Tax=Chlamydomonas sphaeroides TaxID=28458 RepID=A0A125SQG7_9CHLO|nr:ethanolamine kinase [Chlamydomonas sphaeroides]